MRAFRYYLGTAAVLCIAATAWADPIITLNPDQACYDPGDTVTVTIDLTGSGFPDIVGGQFFLEFDTTNLSYGSASAGSPWTVEVYENVSGNQIDYAVGIVDGGTGATSGTMATLTFTAGAQICSAADLVTFRTGANPPTRLGDVNDLEYSVSQANLTQTDLSAISIDNTDPVLGGVPLDITLECDDALPPSAPSRAWGMWANSGGVADAIRTFDTALGVGDTLKVDMDTGFIGTGTVGFGLRNTPGANRFELLFVGGNTNYTVIDSTGSHDAGLGFTDEGLHVEFTLTAADTYSVTIYRLSDNASVTMSGTLSSSGAIDRFRAFNADAGSGSTNDAYFNNLSIGSAAFDYAADPAYDDGWDNGDDGGAGLGAWALGGSGAHGHFVGSSTGNGDGDDNSDGDIDGVTGGDNCSVTVSFSENTVAGSCAQESVITRTWTAEDACGNTTSQSQIITIVDTTDPSATAPTAVTVECIGDVPAAAATYAEFTGQGGTASDNCTAGADLTITYVDGALTGGACGGTITRTYTVADECGNSVDVDQTITVDDTIDPSATAPTAVTVECIGDVPAAAATYAEFTGQGGTASDNCTAGADLTITYVDGALTGGACGGTITRTYTVADECGNSVDVDQTITVDDTIDPSATAPTAVTVECIGDVPAAAATYAEFTGQGRYGLGQLHSRCGSDDHVCGWCVDRRCVRWHDHAYVHGGRRVRQLG